MRLVAGFLQRAGGGPCIFFAQVGQQDLFAHAHAAGNGLANGTTANQNDDLMPGAYSANSLGLLQRVAAQGMGIALLPELAYART